VEGNLSTEVSMIVLDTLAVVEEVRNFFPLYTPEQFSQNRHRSIFDSLLNANSYLFNQLNQDSHAIS
jgi:hypothetical protein